jgi:hypothetical protein
MSNVNTCTCPLWAALRCIARTTGAFSQPDDVTGSKDGHIYRLSHVMNRGRQKTVVIIGYYPTLLDAELAKSIAMGKGLDAEDDNSCSTRFQLIITQI